MDSSIIRAGIQNTTQKSQGFFPAATTITNDSGYQWGDDFNFENLGH